jgi:hypothetical protein
MPLISGREAARMFGPTGLSLSATQQLLATGIAGKPQVAGGANLYDGDRVEEVATRLPITPADLEDACPLGVVVVRLPRGQSFSALTCWPETADLLAGPWRVGNGDGFAMTGSVAFGVGLPLVLSVSGYVVAGAWVTAVLGSEQPGHVTFGLSAPDDWLTPLLGRRLRGHRGVPVELVAWRMRPRTRSSGS